MQKRKAAIISRIALIVFMSAVVCAFPAWAGYVDHGDGTVTDMVTQLMWQKGDDGNSRTWKDALAYCESLDLAGLSDWRLPNNFELGSLVDLTRTNPAGDPIFSFSPGLYNLSIYWCSTTMHDSDAAGNVDFHWGGVNNYYCGKGPSTWYTSQCLLLTRCVRGGLAVPIVTLTISKLGTGTGRIVSAPTGIDCGSDCRENYPPNTSVILTATPDSGATFAGWSGGSGTDTCVVTVDRNMTVVATFGKAPPTLIGPGDNNSINDKDLTFEWSAVDGAVGYELQVDNDCEFNSPEVALYLAGGSITSKTFENYLSDGTYCWKVRAKFADGSYSAWSSPGHFTYHLPAASKPFWVPLYRMYKGSIESDHFYTTNAVERDAAIQTGWTYERIECSISSHKGPGMVPLFRLYYDRPTAKDHFYTTNETERDNALALNATRKYVYEGIAGFVHPSQAEGTVALFRLWKAANIDHFYCTRASERDYANVTWSFENEGTQCYVMPSESPIPLSHGRPSGYYGSTDTAVGAYLYSHTDLSIPSPGPAIRFERSYNSRSTNQGILGIGWTHNYDWHIYQDDSSYIVHTGNGRIDYYNLDFTPKDYGGVYDNLSRAGDVITLTTQDKTQYIFGYLTTSREGFFLKQIVDRYGNQLQLGYNSDGKLATVQDPVGRQIVFGYDSAKYLLTITDPLSRTLDFHVNSQTNNLEWSKDFKGNTTTYVYDKDNGVNETHRIKTVVRPGNKTLVTNTYQDGMLVSQADALNNTTTFSYGDTGTTTILDPLGKSTVHEHDDKYQLKKMTDPRTYSEQSNYDNNHELTSFKDRRAHDSAFAYVQGTGNLTTTTHDIVGDLSIKTNGSTDTTIQTQLGYDTSLSNLYPSFPISSTDALGKTTQYEYDTYGSLKVVRDPMVLQDPSINPITREYYANGQIKKVTDKKGRVTQYFYEDQWSNLTRMVDPLGGETGYTYDAVGRRASVTNARGFTTSYAYDLNDNLVTVTDPLGNQTSSQYDENNNLTQTVDAREHAVIFYYDAKDQLITREDQRAARMTYAYNRMGRCTSATNENGQVTTYQYDEDGNLVQVSTPLASISFIYDENGNLIKTVDGRSKAVQNTYNAMDQLSSTKDPLNNATTYFYRKDGNIFSRQDPNGVVTEYSYDDLGQLTAINYVAYPAEAIHFAYDNNGNLTNMTDPAGVTTFVHDENDRLVSVTDPYSKTVSYSYDLLGNRTSITYPGNKTVSYEYDSLNRLSKVTDWFGGATVYSYDEVGNLVQVVNPNGTKTLYGYDNANRMISLSNQKSDGTIICSYFYSLDNLGNITNSSIEEPLSHDYKNENVVYEYDDANRLTSEGDFSYLYDNNGNLTQRTKSAGITTFAYNHENLLSAISGTSNIQNVYNGFGHRIARSLDNVQTRYVLDMTVPLPNLIAETDYSGAAETYFIYGVGLISRISANGSRLVYHFNRRGDTVAMTDSSQTATDAYTYDEYGMVTRSLGTTPNPFKFVGRFGVMDEGNEFFFMRARYYDAKLGVFLSKDSIENNTKKFSLYAYSNGNPLRFIDPSGTTINAIGDSNYVAYVKNMIETLRNNSITKNLVAFLDCQHIQVNVRKPGKDKNGKDIINSAAIKPRPEDFKDNKLKVVNIEISQVKSFFVSQGGVTGNDLPSYIALAHELGHAQDSFLTNGEAFKNPEASENFTISSYENPLRKEIGMVPRNYYLGRYTTPIYSALPDNDAAAVRMLTSWFVKGIIF